MKKTVWIKRTVVVLLSAVYAVSAWQVSKILHEEKKAEDCYEDFQNLVVMDHPPEKSTSAEDEPSERVPVSIDLAPLQEQYPDVIGWLYCEGTEINYPVAQGKNNSQYLRHLLDGTYNTAGTLFADYRNKEKNGHLLIYGHNMKNGTMFGSLVQYKKQEYYDEHPVLYYFTSDKVYKVELIAGYVTSSSSDAYRLDFGTEESVGTHISEALKKSTFHSNVSYTEGDRLMTLSTCSYEYSNARYVVVGLMKEL